MVFLFKEIFKTNKFFKVFFTYTNGLLIFSYTYNNTIYKFIKGRERGRTILRNTFLTEIKTEKNKQKKVKATFDNNC